MIPEKEPTQLLGMFHYLREFLFGIAVAEALLFTHLIQARVLEIHRISS
jgi:hypothetical protein